MVGRVKGSLAIAFLAGCGAAPSTDPDGSVIGDDGPELGGRARSATQRAARRPEDPFGVELGNAALPGDRVLDRLGRLGHPLSAEENRIGDTTVDKKYRVRNTG